MENFLMFEPSIRAKKEGPVDAAIGTYSGSTAMPFIPIDGSMTIDGSAFADADAFEISVSRGPTYKPQWGSQFIAGAGPGASAVSLSWDLWFDSVTELNRFFGDHDHALATRLDPQDVLQTAAIVINCQNAESAGNSAQPFQLQLSLPRIIWTRSGPYITGKEAIRQPLQGTALYDSTAGFDFAAILQNSQANATVIG